MGLLAAFLMDTIGKAKAGAKGSKLGAEGRQGLKDYQRKTMNTKRK